MQLPDSAALEAAGMPDAVVCVAADGTVAGANRNVERLLGWGSELVGQQFFRVLRPRDADGVALTTWPSSARLRCVRGVPETEVDCEHAAGRPVKCAVTVAYHRVEGRFLGGVISLRDLGGRRLESAAARAVAVCAHEIRAPLTGVRGFASLLLRKGGAIKEAQREEMLGQILADAERMTRLVGELLDVSRMEAGRLTLGSSAVNVRDVAAAAIEQARGAVPDRAEAVVTLDVDESHAVEADKDKLLQILVNLVENALKYGDEPVRVTAERDSEDETVAVVVRDAGYVPPEQLPRLFSKYWRRERPGRPSGTGLGLYIAKGLAEAQGGSLAATSGPTEGTAFRVSLPEA